MELELRTPKVVRSKEIIFGGTKYHDTYEPEVPQEMSDYAREVVGDGKARIAVTTDMSFKEYGNGVSSSVTLSLSCNQDDQTVNNVVQTLGAWSRAYCKQQLEVARNEYQQLASGAPVPPAFKP